VNILLWALQILLALHTLMGAVWKFSHSPEQSMASLKAIPPGLWSAMAILELLCCLALLAPALRRSLARLGAPAAAFILAEMLLFRQRGVGPAGLLGGGGRGLRRHRLRAPAADVGFDRRPG